MNIVLIGYKNAGKTTVGRELANHLDRPFIDIDKLVENQYFTLNHRYCSVREIAQFHDEAYFRKLEYEAVLSLENTDNSIISTGGGVVLNEENMRRLKKRGKVIYLMLSREALAKRTRAYLGQSFDDIYRNRQGLYPRFADVIVNIENKSVYKIVKEIIDVQ